MDITYCTNTDCPFKDCEKHYTKLKTLKRHYVSLSDFGGICERYLNYLLEEIEMEEKHD